MGLAVIPDDWTAGYVSLCVDWPDSPDWLAILRGLLTSPHTEEFWDKFTGTPSDALAAIMPTFDNNLHMGECMIVPTGFCGWYAGASPPSGWLERDGSAVSRTTYADLFDILGTIWGAGDGSTTFNLPNAKGKVDVGKDVSIADFNAVGVVGGTKDTTLTTNQLPAHSHAQDQHTHVQPSHNHIQSAHNHVQNNHSHTIFGSLVSQSGTDRRTLAAVSGASNVSSEVQTATNIAETAINQAATVTNNNTIATNQNTGAGLSHSNLQPYGVYIPIIKA